MRGLRHVAEHHVAEHRKVLSMSVTVQAVFEGGVFRPLTPIKVVEGALVEVTIPDIASSESETLSQDSPRGFADRKLLPEFAALRPIAGDTTLETC